MNFDETLGNPIEVTDRFLGAMRRDGSGWLARLTDLDLNRVLTSIFENAALTLRGRSTADVFELLEYVLSELGPEVVQENVPVSDRIRYVRSMSPLFRELTQMESQLVSAGGSEADAERLKLILLRWWDCIALPGQNERVGLDEACLAAIWDTLGEVILLHSDACAEGSLEGLKGMVILSKDRKVRLANVFAKLPGRGKPLPESCGAVLRGLAVFSYLLDERK